MPNTSNVEFTTQHRSQFSSPLFLVFNVVLVYLMMMTGLVRVLEWILQPYLLLRWKERSSQKLLRKSNVKGEKSYRKRSVMSEK